MISLRHPAETFVPLYHRLHGQSLPQPAYLQLSPKTRTVSFDWRRDHLPSTGEKNGTILRFEVPPALRGSYCVSLVAKLTPALERIIAGFTVDHVVGENGEIIPVGVLDDDAQAAVSKVGLLIDRYIDPSNTDHVAAVCSSEDYLRDVVADDHEMTAEITDEKLTELADDHVQQAESDGTHIDGSLIDELFEHRDSLR